MYRKMLKSKIHRARVTHADLNYEGSITISPELLKSSNILPFEAVSVWNVTQGTRFETYTIIGAPNSSSICVNGAAAHLVSINDLIIIASFAHFKEEELQAYSPTVVFVDYNNKIATIRPEIASFV